MYESEFFHDFKGVLKERIPKCSGYSYTVNDVLQYMGKDDEIVVSIDATSKLLIDNVQRLAKELRIKFHSVEHSDGQAFLSFYKTYETYAQHEGRIVPAYLLVQEMSA